MPSGGRQILYAKCMNEIWASQDLEKLGEAE
jgi:hypothetical protein